MSAFPVVRLAILLVIIAGLAALALYLMTLPDSPAARCPADRPVRVQGGSCVPREDPESTHVEADGVK